MPYKIQKFVTNELGTNCYIAYDDNGDAVMVDPGGRADLLLKFLRDKNLNLRVILNTHAHIDHIASNATVKEATGAIIGVNPIEAFLLGDATANGADYFGWPYTEHEADFALNDGDFVGYGHMKFKVVHTPGHSPGHVCLVDAENMVIFAGDLVFKGSIGRWDLPGGDRETLMVSLHKFLKFPDGATVYPGHGDITTVAVEKRTNPYLLDLLETVAAEDPSGH